MSKCVLAYSGGLDTSVAVRWIAEQYDVEVIALAVDVGALNELLIDSFIRSQRRPAVICCGGDSAVDIPNY